jgi:hypothetical protein
MGSQNKRVILKFCEWVREIEGGGVIGVSVAVNLVGQKMGIRQYCNSFDLV